jgi:tRNA threonylcarbamoyladenosine biosynthesis protein TsaB
MLLFSVDTCDSRGSVALLQDNDVLAIKTHETAEDYSSWLIPASESVLQQCGRGIGELDAYVVASGPGSFTGVRIGLTTIKAWSEVFGKPVLPISRLEAIASQVSVSVEFVAPFFDARRNQLFGALYRRTVDGLVRIGDEAVIAPAEYIEWVMQEAANASIAWASLDLDGVRSNSAWKERNRHGDIFQQVSAPLAPAIGQLGFARMRLGKVTNALHLDANYVRRSDAEMFWKSPAAKSSRA